MNGRTRFFWSGAVLLMAAVTPLAMAERQWVHWGLCLLTVCAGYWSYRRRNRPLLGVRGGAAAVLGAFGALVVEAGWLGIVPVVALSHFLTLVCAAWLLQRQTVRQQKQFLVICLLLVVVASIVSGDLLFPFVLVLYLGVGAGAMMRVHLAMEQARVDRHNQGGDGRAWAPPVPEKPARVTPAVVLSLDLVTVAVGAMLFVFFPRVGAGMLGPWDGRPYGRTTSGLGSALSFEDIGPIQSSEEQVMTVRIEDAFGRKLGQEVGTLYFRGMVFDRYGRPDARRGWQWRVGTPRDAAPRDVVCRATPELEGGIRIIPGVDPGPERALLRQHYWLQPAEHHHLFVCHPALEIRSTQFTELRKRVADQTLQVYVPRRSVLRYDVVSAVEQSPRLIAALVREREEDDHPRVRLPEPRLPRENEIRQWIARIDERAGTAGPLDEAPARRRFVEAAIAMLRSAAFEYTTDLDPVPWGREPIGDFLFTTRRGHCEYFASALALICQHRGIPARLVTGYLGGDYNAVGGYFVVRQRHAHAWTEVAFPGGEWVTFDATPGGGLPRTPAAGWGAAVRKYLDFLRFQWNNQVVGYDANLRNALLARFAEWLARPVGRQATWAGTILAFIGELVFWRMELSPQDRLLYYAFTVMVVVLVVLTGYAAAIVLRWVLGKAGRSWRAHRSRAAAAEADFYVRFCRRVESLGFHRRLDQTPAEFADEIARRFDALAPARDLVGAYYEVVFGRRAIGPQRLAPIEAFLNRLRSLRPADLRR